MKKALSVLLAIVMIFSMVPLNAFAETTAHIRFETNFTNDLVEGDVFTVTAYLDSNPGMATITLSMDWNDQTLSFEGFDKYEDDFPVSEVFETRGWTVEAGHDTGIVVATRTSNNTSTGTLFTANFKIVGDGALELGLKTGSGSEFQMKNLDSEDLNPTVDYSAISNLTVGGKPVGPEIPEELVELGVSAMTTDNGAVLDYTLMKEYLSVNGGYSAMVAPYYLVTIPQDAENVYVTFNTSLMWNQVGEEKWPSNIYGQVEEVLPYEDEPADVSYVDNGNMSCLPYYDQESNIVEIPVIMDVLDWSGNPTGEQFSVLRTDDEAYGDYGCSFDEENGVYSYYVVGFQADITGAPVIAFFAFTYAEESGEEEDIYTISIDENMVGGTVWAENAEGEKITQAKPGDVVLLQHKAEEGYEFARFFFVNDDTNQETECANGAFDMPWSNVTIKAVFTAIHTCSYTESVVDAKYLKSEATCQSGAVYYKSCTCGEFAETAETFISGEPVPCVYGEDGTCKWCGEAEPVVTPGYTFATSADVSALNGGTAVVHVKITGHSNENIDFYNAYDVTLTFDSDKLELVTDENGNYIYSGAVVSDGGSVTVVGNTIHIVGCGTGKEFGTEIIALTFKTKAEGNANVTISKVQVSDKDTAVDDDVPEATAKHAEDDATADTTPTQSVIVVPYSVDKPDFISGKDNVVQGADYTFSYTDTTNYTYTDLTVTVGGTPVTPTEANGVYTIAGVTGAIKITATQTPNSYDVFFNEENTAKVEGPGKATYRENYIFTVTPSTEDMAIDTVKVTLADGTEVDYTINENGQYVIAGTDITGEFTITVTETNTKTSITFTGIEESEIEGGLIQTAKIGVAFPFQLNKVEGFDYTVKVGDTVLEEKDGEYTIPAELVVAGGVQVDITKEDNTKPVIDVVEYISLDGEVMFLVTAKWGDRVLAYGEEGTMYWSGKYTVTGETEAGAYCWLVLSTNEMNTIDLVKAAAEDAIVEAAEGTNATAISYDYEVNGTNIVDVNDAQLVYDMYNASYMEFTDTLPMWKFLAADMETDGKLDTQDVVAIISYIVSGANE